MVYQAWREHFHFRSNIAVMMMDNNPHSHCWRFLKYYFQIVAMYILIVSLVVVQCSSLLVDVHVSHWSYHW